jgi:hypothetical protein
LTFIKKVFAKEKGTFKIDEAFLTSFIDTLSLTVPQSIIVVYGFLLHEDSKVQEESAR